MAKNGCGRQTGCDEKQIIDLEWPYLLHLQLYWNNCLGFLIVTLTKGNTIFFSNLWGKNLVVSHLHQCTNYFHVGFSCLAQVANSSRLRSSFVLWSSFITSNCDSKSPRHKPSRNQSVTSSNSLIRSFSSAHTYINIYHQHNTQQQLY